MIRTALPWVAAWATLTVLYLLLVDTTTGPEVAAAALSAATAVGMAGLAARLEQVRFAPQTSWFLLLLRKVPPQVIGDTILVVGALWNAVRRRPVDGAFHIVPFEGGGPDARSAARRALIVAGISLPPNTYVIDINKEEGYLLVHQLVRRGRPPGNGDRQWPL